jgi:hypothetical protein
VPFGGGFEHWQEVGVSPDLLCDLDADHAQAPRCRWWRPDGGRLWLFGPPVKVDLSPVWTQQVCVAAGARRSDEVDRGQAIAPLLQPADRLEVHD